MCELQPLFVAGKDMQVEGGFLGKQKNRRLR
jgi:hypothetical protein